MILRILLPVIPGTVIIISLVVLHIKYAGKKRNLELVRSKVSHDLRSPLNAVIGFSDLLLQTEDDDEKRKFLEAIKSGGETQLTTIDDLAATINNNFKSSTEKAPIPRPSTILKEKIHNEEGNSEHSDEALIMIVDDMEDNVVFLEKILQKSGFRTISALSGDAALSLLTEYTPDLILLDIVMPEMSGFETCARIQNNKDFIDIPVIFLSAKKDEKTIIESFVYGGIDYIIKPFNSPELLARVNTHLQLKRAKERLHILAFTDELTGLYNRRKIIEMIDQEQNRALRYKEYLSFIMIDIDYFKKINDTYGHEIGDRALVRFSSLLKDCLRETDFSGRLGGEEFGIILPKTNLDQAAIVAERIRSRIELDSASVEEGIPPFTVSLGIAQFPLMDDNLSLLTQDADAALYEAKGSGRNRTCRARIRECKNTV